MNKTRLIGLVVFLTLGTVSQSALAQVTVFVGYADGVRPGGYFPDPWQGSPNTIFLGGGSDYDAGAIRIRNDGAQSIVLGLGAYVDGFSSNPAARYQIWDSRIGPSGQDITPGGNLILTQTTTYDFDSSEFNNGGRNPAVQPKVHLSLNGQDFVFVDTAQILNTGDFDLASVRNESNQWRPIGTTGILDPGGNPDPPPITPEVASPLALLCAGLTAALPFLCRRKKTQRTAFRRA